MGIYLYCSGTVDAGLAEVTLKDWLSGGTDDCLAVVPSGDCEWAETVIPNLELNTTPFVPGFTSSDTVIAPSDADNLEEVLRPGAVVLDLSDGMIPLELVEETPVTEAPDIPEDLPAPVLEEPDPPAPKKKAPRKKPSLPKAVEPEPTVTATDLSKHSTVSPPVKTYPHTALVLNLKQQDAVDHLRALVHLMVEEKGEDTLWKVLDLLRD